MPTFEVETKVDFEFEVFCANCGAGLCGNCTESFTRGRGMPCIQITPCDTCISNARDEGYNVGVNENDNP
jgi:hypothetical protein